MSSDIEKIKKLEQPISKYTFISRIIRTTLQINKSNMNEEKITFLTMTEFIGPSADISITRSTSRSKVAKPM